MNYTPESPFKITEDNRLVYNLRHHGWRKGVETFENDVWVSIEARHLPTEVQANIARIICTALNRELVNTEASNGGSAAL